VTTTSIGSSAATLFIAVVLIAAAARLQAVREARYPPPTDAQETLYLQSGTTTRRLAGAYSSLMADAYWIRTLQYYGVRKLRLAHEAAAHLAATPESYDLLYPMLDLTTTLDPRFTIAYRFGSVFLSEAYPAGPGRPDLAIALLEKGLRIQPDKWGYMQDIGFVHYWYGHDYGAAAEAFRTASEMPGAPWWLRSLAATTLANGGDRRSSKLMWESIRQSAETDWLRGDAERRLTQLRALDEIDGLQRVVNDYRRREGHPPADWPALAGSGMLRGVPLDPAGMPYELTPDGHVNLSRASRLSPLPTEPVRQMAPPR
jgi:hypothetical protein